MFIIIEILIIYYHYTKNLRILVQLQTLESGRWYLVGKLGTIGIGISQV